MDEKNKLVGAWKGILIGMGVLAVIAGLIALHYRDPEIAKFVSYLLGGGLLLWQVWASSQRAKASEDTAKAMQQTADSTEKGNTAERFKNAIEHLGNESPSVRMGGIYALHHIAQDVEEYRKRVFEILCAHIRETTTQERYKPRKIQIDEKNSKEFSEPSVEVESILKLLFCKLPQSKTYEGLCANLDHANLVRANLMVSNIQKASFFSVNLQDTYFFYSNLHNANFSFSDLRTANFSYANLQGAIFSETNLQDANFTNAKLQGAILFETNLQDANFTNANLQGAGLSGAKNLTAEQLSEAKILYKAKLPDGMEAEIRQHKPELFDEPKPNNESEA